MNEDWANEDVYQGEMIDSAAVIGRNLWQDAMATTPRSLIEEPELDITNRQYRVDQETDYLLYDLLEKEIALLRALSPEPADTDLDRLLAVSLQRLGLRNQISEQESIYDWAVEHENVAPASTLLGWRLQSQRWARDLIGWSNAHPADPRSSLISLWRGSPGFFPQLRLRFWAIRFPGDPRAARIFAAEDRVQERLSKAKLLSSEGEAP